MPKFADAEVFRTTVEHLNAGVSLLDREGKIVYGKHTAETITGYLGQEVVGRVCAGNLRLAHWHEHTAQLRRVESSRK
jgi:PAS domain S-box-containing protein